ncbi:hypothetical protein SEUCBS139899_002064 [Sporothrix eucalyptigena]
MAQVHIDESQFVDLKDKVTIITGASSGIGLAAACFFSSHGARVVAVDINAFPEADTNDNIVYRKVDLIKWNEQLDLFQWTFDTYGRIDVAFLNAGVAEIEDVFVDTFDGNGRLQEPQHKVTKINLLATINGTKLAIHFMRKQTQHGSIVITGSGKCFNGIGGTPMYAVSKHGLLGMLRTLAYDVPPEFNINVNMVCPFWTDTGILSPEHREKLASAKKCMQPANVPAIAAAHFSLNPKVHGMALYAACGKYTDIESGFALTRPIWIGAENHLDRVLFEEDPAISGFKTKFN